MSHVETLGLVFQDLSCVQEAAARLGMAVKQADTYRWYGHHVGDYPLPAGFTKDELGKCEYVMYIPGKPGAYEVGLARAKEGKGWVPLYDFWAGGHGLMEAIGEKGSKLKQEYAIAVATKRAKLEGRRVIRQINAKTGKPQLVMVK